MTATPPRLSFNSARFLTSASRLAECPPDEGYEVAFAGRSNAGKSSAINTLTNNGKLARTSKTPGRTRLINFFSLNQPGRRLVDLPGYGYARVSRDMKQEWQEHLAHYLESRLCLRGLVLLMDIRNPLTEFDTMMLDWARDQQLPVMILLTKSDKLNFGPAKLALLNVRKEAARYGCVVRIVLFSSLKRSGLDEASAQLTEWMMPEEAAPDNDTPCDHDSAAD